MTTYRPTPGALRPRESDPYDSLARRIGSVVWPSFFAAGVATILFFAVVDPLDLAAISWPNLDVSRQAGYTIGFFLLWLCTLSACVFTALLIAPPLQDRNGDTRQ